MSLSSVTCARMSVNNLFTVVTDENGHLMFDCTVCGHDADDHTAPWMEDAICGVCENVCREGVMLEKLDHFIAKQLCSARRKLCVSRRTKPSARSARGQYCWDHVSPENHPCAQNNVPV